MAAPAGPCEWCGAAQNWCTIRGELYVRCTLGCQPLPLEDLAPPPDSEELRVPSEYSEALKGTLREGGGVPFSVTRPTLVKDVLRQPVFTEWLSSLWEGGPLDHGDEIEG